MKIAIFSDPHLGYSRFEEDSYIQAERTIVSASENADLIICAGDIFDIKVPKLETLKRAVDIFNKAKVPIIGIYGNHERRTKDLTNPAQLLASATNLILLHGSSTIFEKNNEKIEVFGMGSVPEEYAKEALSQVMQKYSPNKSAFRIIVLHQSIKEIMASHSEEELSLDELEKLPFDLIINGHIHEIHQKLGGRFLIPGSTVITQLKKDQMIERGYFIYDTQNKTSEFRPIECRKFFYEEIQLNDATREEANIAVENKISELRKQHQDCIIAIKIHGKLKEGINWADISFDNHKDVFIDNKLDSENLSQKIERIRDIKEERGSVKEIALVQLKKAVGSKITRFDPIELFEKLAIGTDESIQYLESTNIKSSKQEQ
jgi:DNA repair exonuclease SbcCD nuclease subunit